MESLVSLPKCHQRRSRNADHDYLNNSGRLGQINWLYGVMGVANAQRSLDYVRFLTEVSMSTKLALEMISRLSGNFHSQFISQPEWTNVIQMFGVINEPRGAIIGQANIGSL